MKVATDLKNAKNAPKNPFFKSKLQAFNYEQWYMNVFESKITKLFYSRSRLQ